MFVSKKKLRVENDRLKRDNESLSRLVEDLNNTINELTINEYQQLALRTEPYMNNDIDRILQGVMGLAGESGECVDLMKKHIFQGHSLDMEHLMKELGDVAWYLAITADSIGYTLEEVFEANIKKLEARYPDGRFEANKSINRKEGDI